jgi:hypothetical protein
MEVESKKIENKLSVKDYPEVVKDCPESVSELKTDVKVNMQEEDSLAATAEPVLDQEKSIEAVGRPTSLLLTRGKKNKQKRARKARQEEELVEEAFVAADCLEDDMCEPVEGTVIASWSLTNEVEAAAEGKCLSCDGSLVRNTA